MPQWGAEEQLQTYKNCDRFNQWKRNAQDVIQTKICWIFIQTRKENLEERPGVKNVIVIIGKKKEKIQKGENSLTKEIVNILKAKNTKNG